jgi:hypothetical protein
MLLVRGALIGSCCSRGIWASGLTCRRIAFTDWSNLTRLVRVKSAAQSMPILTAPSEQRQQINHRRGAASMHMCIELGTQMIAESLARLQGAIEGQSAERSRRLAG